MNEQGTPLPPYDFPLQGGAGFQLAAQMRDKWYGAMTTTKPISEQPYDPGKPASNQWYMELGDNKIATAYRIKDGYQIEPVLGAAPNLGALDIIGPYSNCILIAVPLDRPRTIGARIAAQLTACLATPFTLVGDTVDFPEQVLLITVAHILRD